MTTEIKKTSDLRLSSSSNFNYSSLKAVGGALVISAVALGIIAAFGTYGLYGDPINTPLLIQRSIDWLGPDGCFSLMIGGVTSSSMTGFLGIVFFAVSYRPLRANLFSQEPYSPPQTPQKFPAKVFKKSDGDEPSSPIIEIPVRPQDNHVVPIPQKLNPPSSSALPGAQKKHTALKKKKISLKSSNPLSEVPPPELIASKPKQASPKKKESEKKQSEARKAKPKSPPENGVKVDPPPIPVSPPREPLFISSPPKKSSSAPPLFPLPVTPVIRPKGSKASPAQPEPPESLSPPQQGDSPFAKASATDPDGALSPVIKIVDLGFSVDKMPFQADLGVIIPSKPNSLRQAGHFAVQLEVFLPGQHPQVFIVKIPQPLSPGLLFARQLVMGYIAAHPGHQEMSALLPKLKAQFPILNLSLETLFKLLNIQLKPLHQRKLTQIKPKVSKQPPTSNPVRHPNFGDMNTGRVIHRNRVSTSKPPHLSTFQVTVSLPGQHPQVFIVKIPQPLSPGLLFARQLVMGYIAAHPGHQEMSALLPKLRAQFPILNLSLEKLLKLLNIQLKPINQRKLTQIKQAKKQLNASNSYWPQTDLDTQALNRFLTDSLSVLGDPQYSFDIPYINRRAPNGMTPLMAAAWVGDFETATLLLADMRTNPYLLLYENASTSTAKGLAELRGHLKIARLLDERMTDDIPYLLESRVWDPNGQDLSGKTPLMIAASLGKVGSVYSLLSDERVNPYIWASTGHTAKHFAESSGQPSIVDMVNVRLLDHTDILLEQPWWDPNQVDFSGMTPLKLANKWKHARALLFLLADERVSREGVESSYQNEMSISTNPEVEEYCGSSSIKELLKKDPVDFKTLRDQRLLTELDGLLQDPTWNPNEPDIFGMTPLMRARKEDATQRIKLLLNDPRVDQNRSALAAPQGIDPELEQFFEKLNST